jgi:cytoskeletal protein RodZ
MKKNKLPSLITILVLTLLTSIIWVSFSVYRAITAKPPESVPSAVSAPLVPTFDTPEINKIESSLFLDNSQIPQNLITASTPPKITPTPVPTVTPVASPSATPLI